MSFGKNIIESCDTYFYPMECMTAGNVDWMIVELTMSIALLKDYKK